MLVAKAPVVTEAPFVANANFPVVATITVNNVLHRVTFDKWDNSLKMNFDTTGFTVSAGSQTPMAEFVKQIEEHMALRDSYNNAKAYVAYLEAKKAAEAQGAEAPVAPVKVKTAVVITFAVINTVVATKLQ